MRWTDLPVAPATRSVQAWRHAMLELGELTAASVEAVAAHALASTSDGNPVVAIQHGAIEAALAYFGGSRLERGGLLVGEALVRDDGDTSVALVHVRTLVPGLDSDATPLSLRLEAGVWDAARALLREGEVVVGWAHSHPGLGAFFSDTDRRTQAGFFTQPFSLGWVIDPQRGEEAWFLGPASRALTASAVLVLDEDGAASRRS